MIAGRKAAMLPTLTGLRGIAALAVLFYHIRLAMTGFLPEAAIALLAHGYLAVDLFFVLSGFVLWWNYGAGFAAEGHRAAPRFLVRRIARIFPLHLAILSAMLVFVAALILSGRGPGKPYDLAQLPAHYLLVQNWGFTDRLTWNVPAWSISTEWAAYLLLAAGGGLFARLPSGRTFFPAFVALLSVTIGIWFAATGRASIGDDIAATGLLRCLAEFAMGVALCRWWSDQRERADGARVIYATAIGLALLSATLLAAGLPQPMAVPLAMVAVVIFALQASLAARPALSGRTAQWLGDISYAVYLSHFFLWILFKLFFVDDLAAVGPAQIGAFLLLTLGLSHLLHIGLEIPARRIVQRGGDGLLATMALKYRARRSQG